MAQEIKKSFFFDFSFDFCKQMKVVIVTNEERARKKTKVSVAVTGKRASVFHNGKRVKAVKLLKGATIYSSFQ